MVEDEIGNSMHIILDGKCSILKLDKESGQMRHIVCVEQPQCVGDKALDSKLALKRDASVVAVTDVMVMTLSKEAYDKVLVQEVIEQKRVRLKFLETGSVFKEWPQFKLINFNDKLGET